MTDEFGVDLDEVFHIIDVAEVIVMRFHLIEPRLLIDFRTKPGVLPFMRVVPRAQSVEDRFRSIKRLRPQFPFPDKVMSVHWPRSIPVLLASGVWQRLVDRISALGDDETTETCGRIIDELLASERREVSGAIRGADHYQTLWERHTA
ncbi:MAG TPA: hypothetical protein VJQ83_09420 [Tepidiformaceae bacterium]|nr:hypothetical protein [Tepidiformaceae bacterium]